MVVVVVEVVVVVVVVVGGKGGGAPQTKLLRVCQGTVGRRTGDCFQDTADRAELPLPSLFQGRLLELVFVRRVGTMLEQERHALLVTIVGGRV